MAKVCNRKLAKRIAVNRLQLRVARLSVEKDAIGASPEWVTTLERRIAADIETLRQAGYNERGGSIASPAAGDACFRCNQSFRKHTGENNRCPNYAIGYNFLSEPEEVQ